MQINLTWDLFIIVFFLIILSYSFIIGKIGTVKLLVSSYLSILTADALGNLFNKAIIMSPPLANILHLVEKSPVFVILKIAFFVCMMIVLVVKGGFKITLKREDPLTDFFLNFLFGILTAGMIIAGILVFSSGASFIMGGKRENSHGKRLAS